MHRGHILIVDDEPEMLVNCRRLLARDGHGCTTLSNGLEFLRVLRERRPDAVLSDLRMPNTDGMELLAQCRGEDPELPFILITAYATISSAVKAMQEGAFDYLTKPFTAQELSAAVQRALRHRLLTEENRQLRSIVEREAGLGELLGESSAILGVIERIRKVATSDANVLISGESGTGKELVAHCIHSTSHRRDRPFVPVDCAAIPPTLMESTLFGHEKGAFTGATSRQRGLLEQANFGTLFFDEITELPLELQARLLRALQEREVRRVGSNTLTKLDVRVVAATNLNPSEAVSDGRLREDLYYRLNVIPISVPPLRERGSDIVSLLQTFLRHYAEEYQRGVPGISRGAWETIENYDWPGNVRELKNVAERLVLLGSEETVTRSDLPDVMHRVGTFRLREEESLIDLPYRQARERALRDLEARYAEQLLARHGRNVTRAAAAAGISRRTLHRWLRRLRKAAEV